MRLTPLKVHLILVLFFVVVLIGADTVEVVLGLVTSYLRLGQA